MLPSGLILNLKEKIEGLAEELDGKMGIAIKNLGTGEECLLNAFAERR